MCFLVVRGGRVTYNDSIAIRADAAVNPHPNPLPVGEGDKSANQTRVRLAHVSSPFGRGWVRVRSLNRKPDPGFNPSIERKFSVYLKTQRQHSSWWPRKSPGE